MLGPLRPEPLVFLRRRMEVQAFEQVRVAAGPGQPRGIPVRIGRRAAIVHVSASLGRSILARVSVIHLRYMLEL